MEFRAIQKFLIAALVAIFVISVLAAMSIGASPGVAIFWSFLNIIGANFLPTASLINPQTPFVLLAQALDTQGKLIVTIILTTLFYQILARVDLSKNVIRSRASKLSRHAIMSPMNGMAEETARRLMSSNMQFVGIDPSARLTRRLIDQGMLVINGEPTEVSSLRSANIARASHLLLFEEEDMRNALIAIEAKRLNGRIHIISRVKSQDDIAKMKRAGIGTLIAPETAVGDELANFILRGLGNKI